MNASVDLLRGWGDSVHRLGERIHRDFKVWVGVWAWFQREAIAWGSTWPRGFASQFQALAALLLLSGSEAFVGPCEWRIIWPKGVPRDQPGASGSLLLSFILSSWFDSFTELGSFIIIFCLPFFATRGQATPGQREYVPHLWRPTQEGWRMRHWVGPRPVL